MIHPSLWANFKKALDKLDPLAIDQYGTVNEVIFNAVAEGRTLIRAAILTNEAPDIFGDKPVPTSNGISPKKEELRKRSKQSGYTGDPCPTCGEFRLRRKGTCIACDNCDHSSGCG